MHVADGQAAGGLAHLGQQGIWRRQIGGHAEQASQLNRMAQGGKGGDHSALGETGQQDALWGKPFGHQLVQQGGDASGGFTHMGLNGAVRRIVEALDVVPAAHLVAHVDGDGPLGGVGQQMTNRQVGRQIQRVHQRGQPGPGIPQPVQPDHGVAGVLWMNVNHGNTTDSPA
ncbi:hypothetical protein LGKMAHEF_00389 [Aeromonas salmonicida]